MCGENWLAINVTYFLEGWLEVSVRKGGGGAAWFGYIFRVFYRIFLLREGECF